MATGSVVLHFDVLEKSLAHGIGVHQRHIVDAFDLQAVEEALHHRIIVAIATAAHAGDQPVATDQVAMVPATVNAATIGVHDHTARLATPGQRRSQRRAGKLSVDARAGRPADHLARAQIQNHCEVEPALGSPQAGDITGPLLIRSIGPKVLAKQIGRHTERVTRIGGTPKALCRLGAQPLTTHALGNRLAIHAQALSLQLLCKARRAIAALLRLKELDHFRVPLGLLGQALRGGLPTVQPGVVATARDA